MNKLFFVLLCFFSVTVISCGDEVENYYNDYYSMKDSDSYKKGWIPEFIPNSAKDIYVKYNLDLNMVWICFVCERIELSIMSKKLTIADTNKIVVNTLKDNFELSLSASFYQLTDREFVAIDEEKQKVYYLRDRY